ncbi:hypothetical protein [Pedococcus sp. 5OH_020]|uniref:hypothetical protein n=1 Tax=Pedococcus sp. 5OH_020 TaxID=2989814 RepID=UPI0022E9B006|nr:hypothetical protein [Pedococcus sp. 5OH_020]
MPGPVELGGQQTAPPPAAHEERALVSPTTGTRSSSSRRRSATGEASARSPSTIGWTPWSAALHSMRARAPLRRSSIPRMRSMTSAWTASSASEIERMSSGRSA